MSFAGRHWMRRKPKPCRKKRSNPVRLRIVNTICIMYIGFIETQPNGPAAMSPKTAAALAEIRSAIASGQAALVPAIFSHCFGRAASAAAFRAARAAGIIEVAYTSAAGTPVYRAAGIAAAMTESATAVKH